MKRHQPVAERQEHHERATTAAVIARMIRKLRLRLIALEAARCEEDIEALAAAQEYAAARMRTMHRQHVQIVARRMAIERGIA